ncbi:MAG: efflux RND transporter permease subunit [Methylotenera sp.]|nr:efflux RND transporter permease subunit [Oligoflexia bacterium]
MSLADLSIRRPVFITCIVVIMLALGLFSMQKLGVDLFPNVIFPVVTVSTPYPGAGPAEIETLVSKPLEDEMSTIAGIKRLSSINQEGISTVIAEFTLETDVKFAEQQIRDRAGATKSKLPLDVKEPIIRRIDPADQPILILSVKADLPPNQLYDIANEVIRPRLEQVNQVGLVEVLGGRQREIHVALDRDKLKAREISTTQVANRLSTAGENVPAGKISQGSRETVFRTVGQFKTLQDIGSTVVNFFGSDVPTTINDVGTVVDTLKDEKSRTFINGEKSLFLYVFRQSGANTIAVTDAIQKKIGKINQEMLTQPGKPQLGVVRDGSLWIRANVDDVKESILIGIVLAVVVVFLFLGSGRSTIITGLALPNSLIGAFILMALAGFTINIMTLLALSLSVGLLIDDAIVVRENIFRHIEMGETPMVAASTGTAEVRLAVIATTLAVIAVFGPVGFLKGVVGQFFKEFGLTICFAMAISLFDALTIAPMLSAYFAGKLHTAGTHTKDPDAGFFARTIGVPVGAMLRTFDQFQTWLEHKYERFIKYTLKHPFIVLGASFLIALASCSTFTLIPKTFLPTQDNGEFSVGLDMLPGTDLDSMTALSAKIDRVIRSNREVRVAAVTVGGREGESNVADIYVNLIPAKQRPGVNTSQVKEAIRNQLKEFAYANPKVKDYDAVGGGQRPFTMNLKGMDQAQLEKVGTKVYDRLKNNKGLKDVDLSFRSGKPEFQVVPNKKRMEELGISTSVLGLELRTQIEGSTPAKFRENGLEYDIRVRLKDDQRNLKESFNRTFVPNINYNLVRLQDVAQPVQTEGPTKITRQDRSRYISITADIAPGAGLGDLMNEISKMFEKDPSMKLPEGVTFAFVGQAENFQELGEGMVTAMGFGVLFIFLVLASLYESFVTPLSIMLALPLAFCGSFVSLALFHESLNIFSMIGIIMLLGVASKNSILLVDMAHQLIDSGMERREAIIQAGKTRLRPILMTTMALIAGTIPVAIGLNEASRQRTSMGVAIIGGLISSTLLTLVVVPAAYSFIDRFRVWSKTKFSRFVSSNAEETKPVEQN